MLTIFNEAVLVMCAGLFLIFRRPTDSRTSYIIGWVVIAIITFDILVNFLVLFIKLIYYIYLAIIFILSYLFKRKAKVVPVDKIN